jgi:PhnB protein
MHIIPYLNLSGTAEEALSFYQAIFGGSIEITRWSDMPPNPHMPVSDDWQSKVMHGALTISDTMTVYAADSVMEDQKDTYANNVFLHLEFDSEDELRGVWDQLSAGGTVNMPVDRMFWGAVYGDLVDKYGIGWGLHHQLPEDAG